MKLTIQFLVLILSISFPVFTQESINIIYPENYRFNPSDNVQWSKPDFDDSDWKEYNLGEFPYDQWQGFGWVRFSVKIDSSLIATPLGMKLYLVGAVEIFVDGIGIHKYGTVGTNLSTEKGMYVFENPEVAAFTFLPTQPEEHGVSKHLIAIRISSFITHDGILKGLPPSFDFKIGSLAEY
ncbi:MAG: hypothetical protein WBH40_06155, partial [Ignavibacteriaceae bacterium]